jgi:hypothetical protein
MMTVAEEDEGEQRVFRGSHENSGQTRNENNQRVSQTGPLRILVRHSLKLHPKRRVQGNLLPSLAVQAPLLEAFFPRCQEC